MRNGTGDLPVTNYQEAVRSLLAREPHVSARQAAKYQTRDGRKVVRLTAANLTPTFDDSQFRLLSNYEARIKTESYAYGRRVPSEDKVYRVSVTRQMENQSLSKSVLRLSLIARR